MRAAVVCGAWQGRPQQARSARGDTGSQSIKQTLRCICVAATLCAVIRDRTGATRCVWPIRSEPWSAGVPGEPVSLTVGAAYFIGVAFARWLRGKVPAGAPVHVAVGRDPRLR